MLKNMDFDLIKFTLSPTLEEINRCRKKDLLVIADFYNITVARAAQKRVIKDELYKKLVEEGVFPEPILEQVVDTEIGTEAASSDSSSGSSVKKKSYQDPRLS